MDEPIYAWYVSSDESGERRHRTFEAAMAAIREEAERATEWEPLTFTVFAERVAREEYDAIPAEKGD